MDGERAKAGTPEALIQNYESVFDDSFLEILKTEAEPYNRATEQLGVYTFAIHCVWLPLWTVGFCACCGSYRSIFLCRYA